MSDNVSNTSRQDSPAAQQKTSCDKTPTSSSTPSTRQNTQVFGLGDNGITIADKHITGAKLPTSEQVLRCLMYHLNDGAAFRRTKLDASQIVLTQVKEFYEKGAIPMIADDSSCRKMTKLLEENRKIRVIPQERRQTPNTQRRVKLMEKTLQETFPLWPSNVDDLLKNDEDRAFLLSMKTDRKATFGSKDTKLSNKVKRRLIREEAESERYDRHQREMAYDAHDTLDELELDRLDDHDVQDVDCSNCDNIISEKFDKREHHRSAKVGTVAFIPADIIKRPRLVALATRLKMTPAQQAAYTEALIEESGGDVTKVATSYAMTDRARRCVGQKIADETKDTWDVPKYASLHWDSKLMPNLKNQNVLEERLTVIVGNKDQVKLLGVPSYMPGTDKSSGEIISQMTTDLLKQWKCVDNIVNLTFDTTASNTGHITAACVMIQQTLNRALFWSACRHHVGEVVLTHVFTDLKIEASKSPDISLFTRFRSHYELLPYGNNPDLCCFNPSDHDEPATNLLTDCQARVNEMCESQINFKRNDHKEFIQLCGLYVNGRSNQDNVTFQRPGALHKARWMTKLLYSIKICLFEEHISHLPPGTITTKHQVQKIRDFVTFCTYIYSVWWMSSSSAVDAPWNDLQFFQLLLQYHVVNSVISRSAIKAFQRHLWYLTAEMVPLALFSDKVPLNEKQTLATKLVQLKPEEPCESPSARHGTGFGKPLFPTITSDTHLSDLAGPDSWFMFHTLHLDDKFLNCDVNDWPQQQSYIRSLENIKAFNVVNDSAERGVKLSSDFISCAKGEQHFQNVLQVVENNRKTMPNLRKRKPTK